MITNIKEKIRSVSVPHDQGLFSKNASGSRKAKGRLQPTQEALCISKQLMEKKEEDLNKFLDEMYSAIVAEYPLFWQHRHSRYLFQIFTWAESQQNLDHRDTFINIPTSFISDTQNISIVLEEFQYEMSMSTKSFDKSQYSFLVERFPNDEMNICGPIQVIFKPIKIVSFFTQYRLKFMINITK